MPSLEKDRLAAEAMQCWADFGEGFSSDKQKYPVQQFRAFWAVTKRYAELRGSDPLIIGVSRVQLMTFSISSKGNVSASLLECREASDILQDISGARARQSS